MSEAQSDSSITRERIAEIRTKSLKLLHDYLEDIPSIVVSGEMRYKVQKNWFNAISLILMRPERKGQLDDAMLAKLAEFKPIIAKLQTRDATPEDIKKGNEVLESLIEFCNRKERQMIAKDFETLAQKEAALHAERKLLQAEFNDVHASEKNLHKTSKKIDKAEKRAGISTQE
jgi:hypothetical protein